MGTVGVAPNWVQFFIYLPFFQGLLEFCFRVGLVQFSLSAEAAPTQLALDDVDGGSSAAFESNLKEDVNEPKEQIDKPLLELRTFFPENWLFSLENMTNDKIQR